MRHRSRREFLLSAAAGTTALALPVRRVLGANDTINLGFIGVGDRGAFSAKWFSGIPGVRVAAVCDADEQRMAACQAQFPQARAVRDLRKVIEDKTIDAVVISTCNHWHALATIWGCQAGKHVYVEKPISNNVFEGRQMVAAARKYNRVVQVGTQSRSAPHYQEVVQLLRSGRIGRIHMVKAINSQLRRRVPAVDDSDVPAGLDWNIWQGPAPEKPYNNNRYTYGWRWLWDYGTGDMGNDGVHDLDIARWGLGGDYPTEVQCTADKLEFTGDIQETPDTQLVSFRFPDKQAILAYEQRLWSPYFQEGFENGVAFYGTDGYILIGRRSWKLVEKRNKVVIDKQVEFSDLPHLQNFIDCVKSGERPNCDIEEGYKSTLLAHLGNLSYRLGRSLKFDSNSQQFIDDPQANSLLSRPGRGEFVIPKEV